MYTVKEVLIGTVYGAPFVKRLYRIHLAQNW